MSAQKYSQTDLSASQTLRQTVAKAHFQPDQDIEIQGSYVSGYLAECQYSKQVL